MEIGTDIEKISRFRLKKTDKFIENSFTGNEIAYSFKKTKPEEHLCGFFCAKEALLKTISPNNISLNSMEIIHDKKGKPEIKLLNGNNKGAKFKVSISHSDDYAIAVVAMTKNGKK
jgi:holo-[acyl-carrier protein] synthase